MSRPSPTRLMAFGVTLLALTYTTIHVLDGSKKRSTSSMEANLALGEITIPVEVIETGEAPATVEVRVQP